jgi:four helix bundle protein
MDLSRFKLIEIADQVSDLIWFEVNKWDSFNKETIGRQLVRAVDSISANLSEAYGRFSFPERKRFTFYARGSLCETINWTNKAIRRGLIEVEQGTIILNKLTEVSYKINYYIRSLKKQLPDGLS